MAQIADKESSNWPAQLRAAIAASGMTQAAIAKAAGMTEAQVSRFIAGKRSLRLESAERIGRVVGLQLVASR